MDRRAGSARQARARARAAGKANGAVRCSIWQQYFPGAHMASGRDFVLVYEAVRCCDRDECGDFFCEVRPGHDRGGCGLFLDVRLYGRAGAAVPADPDAEQVAAIWAILQACSYADPAGHARTVLARADPEMRRSSPALIAPAPAPLPLSPAGVVA